LLNGGPTRFYEFSLVQGGVAKPFIHIANDGNLLEYPRMGQTKVKLVMAERKDIIVDFSAFKGKDVFLVNTQLQTDTRKPAGSSTIAAGNQVLKFKVGTGVVADPSRVLTATTKLRSLPPIDLSKVAQRRTFVFGRNGGVWTVNGKIFNIKDISAKPKKGTAEIWTFINDGGGWDHPIHVHFEEGRILTRNGRAPGLDERGRKDVFNLPPNDRVEVYFQFRDFTGKYIIHCHNLVHEDHAMMLRWDIEE
jgi:FtsP/CotA-like multicopper oxidase with cupredoxin domain